MPEFGSSGIRAPDGSEATGKFALRLGRALGTVASRVFIGRDARLSGLAVKAGAAPGFSPPEVTLAGVVRSTATSSEEAWMIVKNGEVSAPLLRYAGQHGVKVFDDAGNWLNQAAWIRTW